MCRGGEGGEGGQRQNMTLLAERTQRHIVFPSEPLALILRGLRGAAGGWGGPSCPRRLRGRFGRSGVRGAWKAAGSRGSGHGTRQRGPRQPPARCVPARDQRWLGQAQKGLDFWGAFSEISCAGVPREPPGVSRPRPLLAPRHGRWPWQRGEAAGPLPALASTFV